MSKIKTLRTVPGADRMIKPGETLTIGKDVSGALARGWVKVGKAEFVGGIASGRKTRAPGAAGSDAEPETRD